jgi:hypothetical protein
MKRTLYRVVLALAFAVSAGCVSFPKTEDDFRVKAAGVYRFVVEQPLADAYEFIRTNSIRCYSFRLPQGGSSINGSLRDSTSATISSSTSTTVGSGVSMIIDLKSLGPSSTEVSAYYLKRAGTGELIEAWFTGAKTCYAQAVNAGPALAPP